MATGYPFLAEAFFSALEDSGSVSAAAGWAPCHVQLHDTWLPLYLKSHPWGEYVFDHAWARAYQQHGRSWFPKLVTSVPFTPISGPRWRGPAPDPGALWQQVQDRVEEQQASSWHVLFPDAAVRDHLGSLALIERHACHFRWFNRQYPDWDGFLGALKSRKRKSVRKERRDVAEQGVTVERAVGQLIPEHWWQAFYPFYSATYLKRFQEPYLNRDFFERLRHSALLSQVMMVMAFRQGQPVATAFYLFDEERLYGRYWGCGREYPALHFELCYYQGIEFAIERGLAVFDPGVQGEHKILRGFEPVITHSLHWLREPAFHDAVDRFCREESQAVRQYQASARELLPYRNEGDGSQAEVP